MKSLTLGLILISGAAFAQDAAPKVSVPVAPGATAPIPAPAPQAAAAPAFAAPSGGTILTLRGLDKITGRPTNIVAPVGSPVKFATLTITVRYCYSTPASETPETTAFVQISDHRPDQSEKPIFSGWMYASTPGLNGMEHPLYDVWAISCNNPGAPGSPLLASTSTAKVAAPDSSDKEQATTLPAEAGR